MGFAANSFGQLTPVTATAESSATIVTQMAITKNIDLRFGQVAVSAVTAGTITIGTDNSVSTSGAEVQAMGGTTSAASFGVTGTNDAVYTISCPATINLTGGGPAMLVTLTRTPAGATSTLSATGTATIIVGGTLSVAAGQPAGLYENDTDLDVTVNYN